MVCGIVYIIHYVCVMGFVYTYSYGHSVFNQYLIIWNMFYTMYVYRLLGSFYATYLTKIWPYLPPPQGQVRHFVKS